MKIQRIDLGGSFGRGVVGVDELELDELEKEGIMDKKEAVAKHEKCPKCGGTGLSPEHDRSDPPVFYDCEACGGTGRMKEPEE